MKFVLYCYMYIPCLALNKNYLIGFGLQLEYENIERMLLSVQGGEIGNSPCS